MIGGHHGTHGVGIAFMQHGGGKADRVGGVAAQRLAQQDLPPDQVQNNLAYLRADAAGARPRTWESLKQPQ